MPAAWRDDSGLRSSGEPRGVVSLACVVRASEAPSMFVPLNVPAKGEWHWLDADALAAAAGAPPGTPLLEAVAPDAGPPGRDCSQRTRRFVYGQPTNTFQVYYFA